MDNWNRKEHFRFFNQFDEPFFGIFSEIDVTRAYQYCKTNGISFFLFYLFHATKAVNLTDEFRFRIEGDNVVEYRTIHATCTISRPDHTFAFSFFPFSGNLEDFVIGARKEIENVHHSTGLQSNQDTMRPDVIHFSSVPWIHFTGVTHARNYKYKDSVPKITFGKFQEKDNKLMMPLSIHAHHGLMDAFHVARYLQLFGKLVNEPCI